MGRLHVIHTVTTIGSPGVKPRPRSAGQPDPVRLPWRLPSALLRPVGRGGPRARRLSYLPLRLVSLVSSLACLALLARILDGAAKESRP
jgi:hypothetical protein